MITTRYFKIVFICLWAVLCFSTEGWGQFIQPESKKEANDKDRRTELAKKKRR